MQRNVRMNRMRNCSQQLVANDWFTATSQSPCQSKTHITYSKTIYSSRSKILQGPATHDTHTHLTALCRGLPGQARTRKVKPIWILLKQKTVSGSGISWAICKSAPCSRQITMPAPHHSGFLQAGCTSCRPTNSIKALEAYEADTNLVQHITTCYWLLECTALAGAFSECISHNFISKFWFITITIISSVMYLSRRPSWFVS